MTDRCDFTEGGVSLTIATENRYLTTMRGLLVDASALLIPSDTDAAAAAQLAEKLETMLDLVCMRSSAAHRPQIDCMAPADLDG